MILKEKFGNTKEFSLHIEQIAAENNITCLDALIEFCRKNSLEPEETTKWVNKNLKEKLQKNFEDLNYLEKSNSLW